MPRNSTLPSQFLGLEETQLQGAGRCCPLLFPGRRVRYEETRYEGALEISTSGIFYVCQNVELDEIKFGEQCRLLLLLFLFLLLLPPADICWGPLYVRHCASPSYLVFALVI